MNELYLSVKAAFCSVPHVHNRSSKYFFKQWPVLITFSADRQKNTLFNGLIHLIEIKKKKP